MLDFLVLGSLAWNVLLLFVVQITVITVVVRGILACQQWIFRRTWHVNTGLVVLGHGLALAILATMNDFVDVGAPSLTFPQNMLHAMAVLWPLQAVFLAGDLLIRRLYARRPADS